MTQWSTLSSTPTGSGTVFTVPVSGSAIAVTGAGGILVSNYLNQIVSFDSSFNWNGTLTFTSGSGNSAPTNNITGLAVDSNGATWLMFGLESTPFLSRIDSTGLETKRFVLSSYSSIVDMTYDSSSKLFYAIQDNGTLLSINNAGVVSNVTYLDGYPNSNSYTALCMDKSGNYFVLYDQRNQKMRYMKKSTLRYVYAGGSAKNKVISLCYDSTNDRYLMLANKGTEILVVHLNTAGVSMDSLADQLLLGEITLTNEKLISRSLSISSLSYHEKQTLDDVYFTVQIQGKFY